MAEITSALVKELRERTGAGMMDCKKALVENGGELDASADWLRTKGLAAAAKKASRVAAEGLIGMTLGDRYGVMVEVNSETDFVARNEAFQTLVRDIAGLVRGTGGDLVALQAARVERTGRTVAEEIAQAVATIGENISLRRAALVEVEEGAVAGYLHKQVAPGLGTIGVLLGLRSAAEPAALMEIGKQLSMHVAATNPHAITVEALDASVVERERAIFAEQARASGKPDSIIERMVEGRVRKFYEEAVLLEQTFVVDTERKVKQVVADTAKAAGQPVEVTAMLRMALGEGIERKDADFAAEVAQLTDQ